MKKKISLFLTLALALSSIVTAVSAAPTTADDIGLTRKEVKVDHELLNSFGTSNGYIYYAVDEQNGDIKGVNIETGTSFTIDHNDEAVKITSAGNYVPTGTSTNINGQEKSCYLTPLQIEASGDVLAVCFRADFNDGSLSGCLGLVVKVYDISDPSSVSLIKQFDSDDVAVLWAYKNDYSYRPDNNRNVCEMVSAGDGKFIFLSGWNIVTLDARNSGDIKMVGHGYPNGGLVTNLFYGDGVLYVPRNNAQETILYSVDDDLTITHLGGGSGKTNAKGFSNGYVDGGYVYKRAVPSGDGTGTLITATKYEAGEEQSSVAAETKTWTLTGDMEDNKQKYRNDHLFVNGNYLFLGWGEGDQYALSVYYLNEAEETATMLTRGEVSGKKYSGEDGAYAQGWECADGYAVCLMNDMGFEVYTVGSTPVVNSITYERAGEGEVKSTTTIDNQTFGKVTPYVLTCVYNDTLEMEYIAYAQVEVANGKTASKELTVTVPTEGNYTVTTYAVESLDTILPLTLADGVTDTLQ